MLISYIVVNMVCVVYKHGKVEKALTCCHLKSYIYKYNIRRKLEALVWDARGRREPSINFTFGLKLGQQEGMKMPIYMKGEIEGN